MIPRISIAPLCCSAVKPFHLMRKFPEAYTRVKEIESHGDVVARGTTEDVPKAPILSSSRKTYLNQCALALLTNGYTQDQEYGSIHKGSDNIELLFIYKISSVQGDPIPATISLALENPSPSLLSKYTSIVPSSSAQIPRKQHHPAARATQPSDPSHSQAAAVESTVQQQRYPASALQAGRQSRPTGSLGRQRPPE